MNAVVVLAWFPDLVDLGRILAHLWFLYGISLLVGSVYCVHQAALVSFSWLAWSRRPLRPAVARLMLPIELYYCLLGPVAYLSILTRSSGDAEFFVDVKPSVLDPLAVVLLVAVWSLRSLPLSSRPRLARGALSVCALFLVAYAVKDLSRARSIELFASHPNAPWFSLLWVSGIVSLYLVPLAIVVGYLRRRESDGRWSGAEGFHFLPSNLGVPLTAIGVVSFLAFGISLTHGTPDSEARETLRRHRTLLLDASEQHELDPRTLAALIYVVQRHQVSTTGQHLETAMTEAWLADATSHMLLSEALDLSIGLAQIKPITAQTALRLVEASRTQIAVVPWPKQYRDVPDLGSRWILPRSWGESCAPPIEGLPPKLEVVEQLNDEAASIRTAALILDLYATHWEEADPSWSIRQRPEILATLYQLGFVKSHPKPNPSSLPFGDRVAAVAATPWLAELLADESG